MKNWKAAELVELNINETASGWWPCDSEKGCWGPFGTHDATGKGEAPEEETKGPSVTPDTLS